MASVTTVQLTDDLDGKKADETVAFALDGVQYEIDLRKANAAALRKALAEFVDVARKVPRSNISRVSNRSAVVGGGEDRRERREYLAAVRAWATETGLPISDRGRIAQDVIDRYESER